MNILIVNPYGIGDVLFTTPIIHALKEEFPDNRIGYMCNKRTAPLLKSNPFIDEIVIYERDALKQLMAESWFSWFREFSSFIARIRRGRYEAALDLSLAANFGFFLMLAGIRKRIGYNYKNRGFYLTASVGISGYDDKHIVEYYNELLKLIEVNPRYRNLELYLNEEDGRYVESILRDNAVEGSLPIIVIAPGGGASWGRESKLKHWPIDGFAGLIDKTIEKYRAAVIIIGDSSEKDLSESLKTKIHHEIVDLVGKTTVGQLAAVIEKSDLFIGNDGGPLHMAVALGKKTVSFFGPVDPEVYGPYPPDKEKHIVLRKELDCSPCYSKFRIQPCQKNRECLEKIDVGQASAAVERLLKYYKYPAS